jgi:hypothetical protein
MAGQRSFFDVDERLAALSRAGDPLERLASVVDIEVFRDELERALMRSDRVRGGRPPYDAVPMFRLLVLQTLYTLSDAQTEYQLRDRLSFMRFVGRGLGDPVQGPRRSGCSASSSRGPLPSRGCSRGSTDGCAMPVTWRWAARSSTPRWWRPAGHG